MKDKVEQAKKIIFIVIIIFCVINRIYVLFFSNETSSKNTVYIVNDEYLYAVINQCILKYVGYLNNEDSNALLSIYDMNYKEQNNITSENVLEINTLRNIEYFRISKLYKSNVNYYVLGKLYYKQDDIIREMDFEITVKLYKNHTFSITPFIENDLIEGSRLWER